MAAMDLVLAAVGWIGAALLLFGYGMVSSSRMSGDGLPYQLLNLVGAVTLMVNSAYNAAWPSAGLNLVWAAIGIATVIRLGTTRQGVAK